MGYRRVPTIYTLDQFKDYSGLEVRMTSIRIGKMRELMTLLDNDDVTDEQMDAMVKMVSDNLVSWNLEEEDGAPVPADRAGVDSLDLNMLLEIITAWMEQLTGPDEELGKDSSSAPSSASSTPKMPMPEMVDL